MSISFRVFSKHIFRGEEALFLSCGCVGVTPQKFRDAFTCGKAGRSWNTTRVVVAVLLLAVETKFYVLHQVDIWGTKFSLGQQPIHP